MRLSYSYSINHPSICLRPSEKEEKKQQGKHNSKRMPNSNNMIIIIRPNLENSGDMHKLTHLRRSGMTVSQFRNSRKEIMWLWTHNPVALFPTNKHQTQRVSLVGGAKNNNTMIDFSQRWGSTYSAYQQVKPEEACGGFSRRQESSTDLQAHD